MRNVHDVRDLKREYMALVRSHGKEVAELEPFKKSLLEMNERHRREAIGMYVKMISKIQKKVARRP